MARKKNKKKASQKIMRYDTRNILFSIIFIIIGIVSLFWTDSIFWYFISGFLEVIFWKYFMYFISPIVLLVGVLLFAVERFSFNLWRFLGLILYLISSTTFLAFFIKNYIAILSLESFYTDYFGTIPGFIFNLLILLFSLFLLFRISYKKIIWNIWKMISVLPDAGTIKWIFYWDETKNIPQSRKDSLEKKAPVFSQQKTSEKQLTLDQAEKTIPISIISKVKDTISGDKTSSRVIKIEDKSSKKSSFKSQSYDGWELPSLDLLSDIWWDITINEKDILNKQDEIIDKLAQFKINVLMTWYRAWPTVTQFRLQPEDGIKLNKIENLKKDLTLALHAKSIRIQAPIPGEWVVGIEVPNETRQAVGLKEVIQSRDFNNVKVDIPLSIWKNVSGNIVVWDLTKMPHLLVAGQTASWKSVGMNGFIISMLYKFSPSELKMIMIDPKRVELSIYNWIPHLLTPVVWGNPEKALNALKRSVAEMHRRYDLATHLNARNFKEYNAKVKKEEKLPYIVIIIDELADFMITWNKKEVESCITSIAQMWRAAWMHLIVATQRPSVDVITWLIKANIPSRISFTVASQIDSRTVIDKAGAEDLLGKWDMLYAPTGESEAQRVQWVLVETHEVESIVNQIKLTIDPNMLDNLYDDSIVNGKSNLEGSILENYVWDQEESPEIIEKAIVVVREAKKWSTSLVQRKLGLWYARAAKVLDILEELWVVGPSNGSKPREVYE